MFELSVNRVNDIDAIEAHNKTNGMDGIIDCMLSLFGLVQTNVIELLMSFAAVVFMADVPVFDGYGTECRMSVISHTH